MINKIFFENYDEKGVSDFQQVLHALNADRCEFCAVESMMVNKVKNQVACKHGFCGADSIDIHDPVDAMAKFSDYVQEHKIDQNGKAQKDKKAIFCKTVSGEIFDHCFIDATQIKSKIREPFK
jgi:hypothetical protein